MDNFTLYRIIGYTIIALAILGAVYSFCTHKMEDEGIQPHTDSYHKEES